jgi:hypothetical protein
MHTIRLRGPWQVEAVERFSKRNDGLYDRSPVDSPGEVRMTMPADWSAALGADFFGRVRYRRIFQKPTGLESGERVFLVVERPRSGGVVELNRKRIGDTPLRIDITESLSEHNHLEIVVEHPALDAGEIANEDSDLNSAGGLVGEVRLEIEEIEK